MKNNKDSKNNVNEEVKERLQKYIASTGLCSRRKADELIASGKIKVNGSIVTEFGTKVGKNDIVEYNGKVLKKDDYEYFLINKPLGYITTNDEQFNRPKVVDLIKTDKRIVSAGRLDMYTSGLLIFSNDGEFINRITHPSYEITKTYIVTIKGRLGDGKLNLLRNGVILDDGYKTLKAEAKILEFNKKKNQSKIEIQIHEGKNRQVRRMFEALGLKIEYLHRSKVGNITIGNLKTGEYRQLDKSEIDYIYNTKARKLNTK